MLLGACSSAQHRLDLVPKVLRPDISERLMDQATHVHVRHQISQLADVWVVTLSQSDRATLFGASGESLEWLEPERAAPVALIAINAGQESYRSLRTDNGWQLKPTPDRLVRIDRPKLGEVELLLPPITPWSSVYLAWYSTPISGTELQLTKDGYSVRAPLP